MSRRRLTRAVWDFRPRMSASPPCADRPDQVIAASRLLGFEQLFMPAVPLEQRDMDGSGWRALGRELGGLATRFAGEGIQLGYHNHNWELKPKDGTKTALELLFAKAEGSPLTWQADVAWLVRGGATPEVLLQRYRNRVVSVHVKDIAPAGANWTTTAGPMSALAAAHPIHFWAQPTKRVAMRSMKVLPGFLLPVRRPCCRMASRIGIRAPLSTITAAAVQSTIWVPTT